MKTHSIKLIAVVIALSCGSVNAFAKDKSVASAMHNVQQAHADHVASGYSNDTAKALGPAHDALKSAQNDAHNTGIAANAARDAAKAAAHAKAVADAQKNLQGARLTDANRTRTQQQVDAGIGAALTAANQQRTQQQVDARNAAAIGAALTEANQQRTAQQVDANAAAAANAATAAAQANALAQAQEAAAHASRFTGMTRTAVKPGDDSNSSIKQRAGDIDKNTPVDVTDESGKKTRTTAGAIAAIDPEAQIDTPINSVFAAPARKGGSNRGDRNSRSEHGTGNGGNNAANSNSAHGLGGGNHIGGGSAQSGSRNVGHW